VYQNRILAKASVTRYTAPYVWYSDDRSELPGTWRVDQDFRMAGPAWLVESFHPQVRSPVISIIEAVDTAWHGVSSRVPIDQGEGLRGGIDAVNPHSAGGRAVHNISTSNGITSFRLTLVGSRDLCPDAAAGDEAPLAAWCSRVVTS